jgi:uncharacterized protein (TIGR00106 family)
LTKLRNDDALMPFNGGVAFYKSEIIPEEPDADNAAEGIRSSSVLILLRRISTMAEEIMLASFTIIPVGTGEELKDKIADIVSIIDASGLPYKLGAMQTTVEGSQAEVMNLIMKCHSRMRELAPRVITSITIDDREGASGRLDGKVNDVKAVLGKEVSHE